MNRGLIFLRVILVLILAVPAGFAFWMLSLFIIGRIYLFLYEVVGLDWFALSNFNLSSRLRGDTREFLILWHTGGFGIYTIHVILYSILALILNFLCKSKIRFKYDLLCILVVFFVISIIYNIRGPRGMIPIHWGRELMYPSLFAMLTFAIFTLATALLDKHSKMREAPKILLSFAVSGVVGFFVSWLVWAILFQLFHG